MSRSRSRSISRSRSRSRSRSPVRSPKKTSGSEYECPFHIRVFVTKGRHAPMVDFDKGQFPIDQEYSAYAWSHSTPTSLIALLYPSFPAIFRSPHARFNFRHVYVDASSRGLYKNKDLISFTGRDLLATLEGNRDEPKVGAMDMELDDRPDVPKGGKKIEEKTFDDYGFVTGDLISISVGVPEPRVPRGSVAAGAAAGAGGRGDGPERKSFGWGDAPRDRRESRDDRGGFGGRGGRANNDGWGRGDPLPPQDFGARGRGGRDDEPRGGGSWRGGSHMGGRGGSRRSQSPQRGDGADRNGGWGRSPPTGRRESFSRR